MSWLQYFPKLFGISVAHELVPILLLIAGLMLLCICCLFGEFWIYGKIHKDKKEQREAIIGIIITSIFVAIYFLSIYDIFYYAKLYFG